MASVELWHPIAAYEGIYEVSTFGQVCSLDRIIGGQRPGSTRRWKGRILAPGFIKGYQVVTLCRDGKRIQRDVAHLVLETFCGPRPDGQQACHWDDDPNNNHLTNLRWDTPAGNSADALRNGRCWLVGRGLRQVQCKYEHLLMSPNLVKSVLEKEGRKKCLACRRATNRKNKAGGTPFNFEAVAREAYLEIMRSHVLAAYPSERVAV